MISSTSQFRSVLFNVSHAALRTHLTYTRSFASVLPSVLKATASLQLSPEPPTSGRLRPQLNIPVDPNHGLYAFFRKVEEDGAVTYETVDAANRTQDNSGRSWTAAELRRKSFKDLHTLWYILARERNLLATQKEEGRRLTINPEATPHHKKWFKIRKSMARIKYVINERRLAYEGAVKIFAEKREALLVEGQQHAGVGTSEIIAEAGETPKGEDAKAADLAAAGLFDTVEVPKKGSEKRS